MESTGESAWHIASSVLDHPLPQPGQHLFLYHIVNNLIDLKVLLPFFFFYFALLTTNEVEYLSL